MSSSSNLTLETLRKTMAEFDRAHVAAQRDSLVDPLSLNYFGGMKVIEDREWPVLRVSDRVAEMMSWCPGGEEVLRDVNAYLLATFGTRGVCKRNQALILSTYGVAIMRAEDAALLRTSAI